MPVFLLCSKAPGTVYANSAYTVCSNRRGSEESVGGEKVSLVVTIESFVTTLARTTNAVAAAEERTGVSHDEFWRSQHAALETAMASGRYPVLLDTRNGYSRARRAAEQERSARG
jgi:hypothetical protein